MTNDPIHNPRRYELIHKKVYDSLTPEEEEEYKILKEAAHKRRNEIAPLPTREEMDQYLAPLLAEYNKFIENEKSLL